ncbi:hypothetical protein C7212DRAFT_350723 [Tuber magnatum]|uniref:Uncharacterized protein n=1 Tax=Tuber magnatum TaxID=42249 RepID=A0A317SW13_9PEZI|nr:hypothetical protein C7212DRAFT_350723 [Tuber magnatum]
MKFIAAVSLPLTTLALAGEIPDPPTQDIYTSGEYKRLAPSTCVNGEAGEFRCGTVDLSGFGVSTWVWTSPEGRELVIIAQLTSACLPQPRTPSIWRKIRVLGNYSVIGSEAENHFVQIFDMRKLAAITGSEKPKTFSISTKLTNLFTGLPVGRTHNIVMNRDYNYAVAVGTVPRSSACRNALIFISLGGPANPTSPCGQCLKYEGPNTRFQGRDICYAYNESSLTMCPHLAPSTQTPLIPIGDYVPNTENQEFLIPDDEYDEHDGVGPAAERHPVTYIWDIRGLKTSKQTGHYKSSQYDIDQNQCVVNGRAYQSNYGGGLRILDAGIKEVGYLDVYPEDGGQPEAVVFDFVGTWASYACFEGRWIMVNTIDRGGSCG